MKLLLDANISWRLADRLVPYFGQCLHVEKSGLPVPARDAAIWEFAAAHNYIIITNDEDFLHLANLKGFPPKVVLLRTGNQSTVYIENLLIAHKSNIHELFQSVEYGFLEIY